MAQKGGSCLHREVHKVRPLEVRSHSSCLAPHTPHTPGAAYLGPLGGGEGGRLEAPLEGELGLLAALRHGRGRRLVPEHLHERLPTVPTTIKKGNAPRAQRVVASSERRVFRRAGRQLGSRKGCASRPSKARHNDTGAASFLPVSLPPVHVGFDALLPKPNREAPCQAP